MLLAKEWCPSVSGVAPESEPRLNEGRYEDVGQQAGSIAKEQCPPLSGVAKLDSGAHL